MIVVLSFGGTNPPCVTAGGLQRLQRLYLAGSCVSDFRPFLRGLSMMHSLRILEFRKFSAERRDFAAGIKSPLKSEIDTPVSPSPGGMILVLGLCHSRSLWGTQISSLFLRAIEDDCSVDFAVLMGEAVSAEVVDWDPVDRESSSSCDSELDLSGGVAHGQNPVASSSVGGSGMSPDLATVQQMVCVETVGASSSPEPAARNHLGRLLEQEEFDHFRE